ncbi:hypothetical protein CXK93_06975 [Stutzerimonas decontaminans]|uniref:Uncharacterized protein n=1 Tax=Stutzerimonas decontaminans TaxID=3022791 RepID=A0ABX4W237_9GAMM|nr:hypothetical protein [Stutzerimonas decontaminans]MCQ4246057.1 hypothetical protein [Stutzerimonas decontaminans]PNF86529.1 hypothetical protein CXK93_06975 [Stutzerimonas decontaminans]
MDKLVAEGVKAVDQPAERADVLSLAKASWAARLPLAKRLFQSAFIDFAAPAIPEALDTYWLSNSIRMLPENYCQISTSVHLPS